MGGLQLPSTSREAMVEANPPRGWGNRLEKAR
jgi:hypothetical protein